jgi:hypothetical protein
MDFPLIPSRSSNLPFREKTDLVPQPPPEASPAAQASAAQALLVKGYSPIGTSRFIDVEFQEIVDPFDLSNPITPWPDFRMRNAFKQYHILAQRKQRKQSAIDLYA